MTNRLHLMRIAVAASGLLIPGAAFAQSSDHDGCTNETLKGDYGFRISGNILNSAGAPLVNREGVAMTHFYGNGELKQVNFVMAAC